jgi:quaternary ammonium compound-resistance protein SugE
MAWLLLVIAGLFETAFAVSLKASNGFTRPVPTVLFVVFALASFGLLALAMRSLPVGTAYAVWTGIGAAGTVLVGILFLGEPTQLARLVSITLIVAGVAGLRIFSGG